MADEDEEAARRIQEQLWMQDAAEAAANNNNDDDEDDAEEEGDDNNNAGNVNEFVRQLLQNEDHPAEEDPGEDDEEEAADDDNNDNAEEEEDHDDDDDEEDEDLAERRRGAVDGGIAGENPRDEHGVKLTRSLKCPLVLYFETDEDMDALAPGNPLLQQGSTVYIGLDKNTKLSLVFNRYVTFVNSKTPKAKGKGDAKVPSPIKLSDLEFVHCALLDPNLSVEASAMMKNDRVRVCKEKGKERQSRAEVLRQQRESDRKYFKDLRQLLPNPTPEGMGCDAVLDCQGRLQDGRGFSQNVLATTVRANSVLISKRCKWLGQKIRDAREEIERRREMTVQDDNEEKSGYEDEEGGEGEESSGLKSGQSDDEEEIIMAEEPPRREDGEGNNMAGGGVPEQGSHKVEDTEDEDTPTKRPRVKVARRGREAAEAHPHPASAPNSIWVTLDHSPQAVKLLLEYCYTNRVVALGQEAFVRGSKYPNAKEVGALAAKQAGPVPPFRKHEWPEGGAPTVSLHLALAGIALAEEARVPRLSLMCELAASQLVDANNVIDVLGACHLQQSKTGNRLPILRKAALLDCIMAKGSRGIDDLYANPAFKGGLKDRCGLVVPSLLDGTVEVLPANMNTKAIQKKKDRRTADRKRQFEANDSLDKNKRTMERIKWRDGGVVAKRMEAAFGTDVNRYASATSRSIWRENYKGAPPRRDPPPMNAGSGRGTKRKSSARAAGAGAGGQGRTKRTTRRTRSARGER